MQFREALAKICTEPIAENGAFLTYAKLSDLCGNDYESVRKISLFYQIDRKLLVAHHIQTEGKAAVPVLLAAYPAVKNIIGENSFRAMISTVTAAILHEKPEDESSLKPVRPVHKVMPQKPPAPAPKPAPNPTPAPQPKKAPRPPKKPRPEQPAKQKTPTPQPPTPQPVPAPVIPPRPPVQPQKANVIHRKKKTPPKAAHGNNRLGFRTFQKDRKKEWIANAIFQAVLLEIAILLCIFLPSISIKTWAKWVIGVLSGGLIITFLFRREEPSVPNALSGLVALAANGILLIRFGSDYAIIGGCISVYLFIMTLIYAMIAFSDSESNAGYLLLIDSFAALVLFSIVISFPLAMQWIVGIAFALVYSFLLWEFVYEELNFEYGLPTFLPMALLAVNLLLLILFREHYSITFRWVTMTCAILSGFHIIHCFGDYEPKFGAISIFNCLAGLTGFILVFIL